MWLFASLSTCVAGSFSLTTIALEMNILSVAVISHLKNGFPNWLRIIPSPLNPVCLWFLVFQAFSFLTEFLLFVERYECLANCGEFLSYYVIFMQNRTLPNDRVCSSHKSYFPINRLPFQIQYADAHDFSALPINFFPKTFSTEIMFSSQEHWV